MESDNLGGIIDASSATYANLKNLAFKAIKRKKIFTIYGNCEPVRAALLARGWVEKLSPYRLQLLKKFDLKCMDDREMNLAMEKAILSNFLVHNNPNLIWNARNDCSGINNCKTKALYNRLQISHLWTTKVGLCAALKNEHCSYIEDIAEINSPRTYTCIDEGDVKAFKDDYKLTACTSLLKWILTMVENDRKLFSESGNIAINVIVFAINRCKEYLFCKQNKDIDKCYSHTTNGQWNAFLKNYYILLAREDIFKPDKENKLPLFLGYARFLLKEIHKYRPQLSCEGCYNIWIIKPAHCSRGRGIRLASKFRVLTELLSKGKYVFQKYIEEPLLIHRTKFDIRQYYLVTNTYPLEIWMYRNCYLKFSSQKYDVSNYHESIHLTNNAVQRKYTNCNFRHPELPPYNMWSLATFKQYLNDIGNERVWDNIIYPGMKKAIVGIMMSCQDSLVECKNQFELYGCDFILDKNYNAWLIEINSSPDLNPTTPVTSVICPEVVSDTFKVIFDRKAHGNASTGNFECIFLQESFVIHPEAKANLNLRVKGHALPKSYFYKGSIQHADIYSNTSAASQPDISAMLQKLKMLNGTDIMQEPNNSTHNLYTYSSEYYPKGSESSESDAEVHKIALVIASQLDNLIDRIPIDEHITNIDSDKSESKEERVAEETDLRNIFKSVISSGQDSMSISHNHNSIVILNPKSLNHTIEKRKKETYDDEEEYDDEILKITERLFSFLTIKEQEYYQDKFHDK